MLEKVRAWTPPTSAHQGLRSFMVEQITSSIDFDCTPSKEPVWPSPKEWHATRVDALRKSVDYHAAEHAKEVARAAERTAWVKALRASLAAKAVTP